MTTFLLLLSLILNGAAIFEIILLYLRQNRLVEAEKKQERIINEIEEVFSAYLFELKEENDKFLELMTKTKVQLWLDIEEDISQEPIERVLKRVLEDSIPIVKYKVVSIKHSKYN